MLNWKHLKFSIKTINADTNTITENFLKNAVISVLTREAIAA